MKNTTSLTAAVKEILAEIPTADTKMVLARLAAEYPNISTSYRPVFGTLRRLQVAAPMEDMVSAVVCHANSNWGKNGWDIIAEAYTKAEIAEELLEEGCKSAAAAIRHFGWVAKIKRDHEKEIMSTAW